MASSRRNIAWIAALAIAGFLLYAHYHHSSRSTVIGGPIEVLVAARNIQKGTPGDLIRTHAGFYRVRGIPQDQVGSAGVIVSATWFTGRVAVKNIARGARLTPGDFSPNESISITPGFERAVTLSSPREINGPIIIGRNVDVLVTGRGHRLREVLRHVRVLNVIDAGGEGMTVTLEVTPTQAGTLVRLSSQHKLVLRQAPAHERTG